MSVSVIIVTYKAEKWIPDLLPPLKPLGKNVIIIDNHSPDNTVELIKSEFSEFLLIESKENLGFGKANNLGIQIALKNYSDFVILLNQDAILTVEQIQEITNLHSRYPEYAILSPIQTANYGKEIDSLFFSYITADGYKKLISDIVVRKNQDDIYDFPFTNAAIWSISANAIHKIGLFNPLFFHYGEDKDYCYRATFHKMKIGVTPKILAPHNRNQKSDYSKNRTHFILTGNLVKLNNVNQNFFKLLIKHSIDVIYYLILQLFLFQFKEIEYKLTAELKTILRLPAILRSRNTIQKIGAFLQ